MFAAGQHGVAVKHADIVQPQEAALEDVQAFNVLAVDPPGEVEEKVMEDARQELRIALAAVPGPVKQKNLVGGPCVDGRVYGAAGPLVRRDLCRGMHIT